jgi:hypothetical protein
MDHMRGNNLFLDKLTDEQVLKLKQEAKFYQISSLLRCLIQNYWIAFSLLGVHKMEAYCVGGAVSPIDGVRSRHPVHLFLIPQVLGRVQITN